MDGPIGFHVSGSDPDRVRAVLEAHDAYLRARSLRRAATAGVAAAGCALWLSWWFGGAAARHLALASWLVFLVLMFVAGIAELVRWLELRDVMDEPHP